MLIIQLPRGLEIILGFLLRAVKRKDPFCHKYFKPICLTFVMLKAVEKEVSKKLNLRLKPKEEGGAKGAIEFREVDFKNARITRIKGYEVTETVHQVTTEFEKVHISRKIREEG